MESDNLILENLNLIHFVIKRMGLSHRHDYYYDIGLIGLIRAARQFDESKGYLFSTYASRTIQNEICVDMRRNRSEKRKANFNTISLDTPIYKNSDGDEILLIDAIPSDENIEEKILEKEQMDQLKKAISTLTDREKEILNYYIIHDMTQKEIAEKMNFTQSYISRRLQIIVKKLKEKLVKNENNKWKTMIM